MLKELGEKALKAKKVLAKLSTKEKRRALLAIAAALREQSDYILAENVKDMEKAAENGLAENMLDRLCLTKERVEACAVGCEQLSGLEDPIGEVMWMKTLENGLKIGAKRVPFGVIGIIYESRPNVTVDAAALCLMVSSAVILRGGKEAFCSNQALVHVMQDALVSCGLPPELIGFVTDTSRDSATALMRMNGVVDVLIPRGGAALIRATIENATVPVIETGTGNCHVYVDEFADIDMALDILKNAKCTRTSVCNACESLLVHGKQAAAFLPKMQAYLNEVELRACPKSLAYLTGDVKAATQEDFGAEFLDLVLSVKVVNSLDEAIDHINHYSTGHSETIVTESYQNANKFLDEVDSAAVYVNASTRFTDGFEFGFGAEMGISTQKLHARGPMGLKEMTSYKNIIYGAGQIR